MQTLDLIAVLIVLTAAFGYVNLRLLKLPPTIGLMALTLLFSMILLIPVLTGVGLRGGISVALALSLRGLGDGHASPHRELIVSMTYVIVVFSILVQGLTVGTLTGALLSDRPKPSDPSLQVVRL